MNEAPLHPGFRHFSELPYSLRVLYTATLLILGLSGATAVYSAWDEDRREAQLAQTIQAAEEAESQWVDADVEDDDE